MSKVKFILNRSGVRELLKSEGIKRVCQDHASRTLADCTAPGYAMAERNYPERVGFAIYAEEYPAIADNLKNNTLLKALK